MEEETVNQAEKLKSVCSRGLIFQQTPSVRCILSLYPEIDHKNISFIETRILAYDFYIQNGKFEGSQLH